MRYVNVIELYTVQEYLSLMYSSEDPGEIFSENTEYIRLVVYAGFMAVIYKVLWQIRITDDCFRDAGQTTIFDGRE